MMQHITCAELSPDDWQRLRDLRLASLLDAPDAFGGNYERESAFTEAQWRETFEKLAYIAASIDGRDIAIMSVEPMRGDFGATCWIGGCWTDSTFRGKGVMRALFNYIDKHAKEKGWVRQGLGVWVDNLVAINSYKSLGFTFAGEKMPGSREGKFFQHMVRDFSK